MALQKQGKKMKKRKKKVKDGGITGTDWGKICCKFFIEVGLNKIRDEDDG